ncbi:MAG: uncharacterized protein QOJ81_610 [Chloroflexota bacterium]|nr:uncharacterized protein [Chloroflexota bacterium]
MELRAEGSAATLWRLDVADSWLARLRGLIGRRGLAAGEGLFLPGTNGVHMLFMRFAIDVLFVGAPRADGARKVLALKANLRPWTGLVLWVRGARGAVEVPADSLSGSGLRVGDYVTLAPAA